MSEAVIERVESVRNGRTWPERPGPQGQEREAMSEAVVLPNIGTRNGRTWPERPGPQGQERGT